MVRQIYLTSLLLAGGLITATESPCEVAQNLDTTPDVWGLKWEAARERGQTEDLTMISRLVLVQKSKDELKIIPIDAADLASTTYIDTPSEQAINLALEANKPYPVSDPPAPNPCLTKIERAAICFDSDGVLDASDKVWKLYRTSPVDGSAKLVAKGPAGSLGNAAEWLTSYMNHDGVVLATRGSFILVRIPLKTSGDELQALTLENSAQKFALPQESTKGAAILASVAIKGRYGIFKVVTGDENPTAGTKLILEKGKNKTRAKPKDKAKSKPKDDEAETDREIPKAASKSDAAESE
jgi:hypothetical protein